MYINNQTKYIITKKKNDDVINDEFAEVVNVTAKHVAESIQEICL